MKNYQKSNVNTRRPGQTGAGPRTTLGVSCRARTDELAQCAKKL